MKIKELYEQVRDGKIISDIDLQREIVYNIEKQELVIDSIVKGIPLPAFYFWENNEKILEVLDGKQRIEAIKKFFQNDIQYQGKLWRQVEQETQKKIHETELAIIICTGNEKLKREIFKRINTLGVPLSKYEVLNGLYHGEYLRGLSSFVSNEKSVRKILKINKRGKNQITILKLLMRLDDKKQQDIEDYVKENQNNSFAEDQKKITKYIKFIADIFENGKLLDIYILI